MADEASFQEENDAPPVAKEKLLKKYIFPKHGAKNNYLAIESNPKTKKCMESMELILYQFMVRKDWW